MVKKSDWKTSDMPEQTVQFVIEKELTADEIERIRDGRKPLEMEDKWFIYYENDKLYIHRSWTGYCIYIVDLSEKGRLDVTVNRDPDQYKESSIECDRSMVNILINGLIRQPGKNAGLMKTYIAHKNNG